MLCPGKAWTARIVKTNDTNKKAVVTHPRLLLAQACSHAKQVAEPNYLNFMPKFNQNQYGPGKAWTIN